MVLVLHAQLSRAGVLIEVEEVAHDVLELLPLLARIHHRAQVVRQLLSLLEADRAASALQALVAVVGGLDELAGSHHLLEGVVATLHLVAPVFGVSAHETRRGRLALEQVARDHFGHVVVGQPGLGLVLEGGCDVAVALVLLFHHPVPLQVLSGARKSIECEVAKLYKKNEKSYNFAMKVQPIMCGRTLTLIAGRFLLSSFGQLPV